MFYCFLVGDEVANFSSPFLVFFVTTDGPAVAGWGNPGPRALGHSNCRQDTWFHEDTRGQADYFGAGHSSTCVPVAVVHVIAEHCFRFAPDLALLATGPWETGEDDEPAASLVGIHDKNGIETVYETDIGCHFYKVQAPYD